MLAALALTLLAGVKDDLTEATRLLKSAQEEAAVQVLTRALDRSGLAKAERAQLYLLLGIARVNLRDEEGASLAFQRALEADAAATLPPKIAAPRARELYESAKLDVARRAALPPVPEPKPEPPAPKPAEPEAPPPPVVVQQKTSTARWFGVVLAGLGAASAGTGGYFMITGANQRSQSVAEPVAVASAQLFERAQTSWAIGLSLVSVGAVLLIAGIVTALIL